MNKRITYGLISVALGMALVATPATAQVKWQVGLGPTCRWAISVTASSWV